MTMLQAWFQRRMCLRPPVDPHPSYVLSLPFGQENQGRTLSQTT